MAKTVETVVPVDLSKPADQQDIPLHNRWHPEIPAVATQKTNTVFKLMCYDWTGGQIKNTDSAEDIKNVDLSRCHHLTGPIRIEDENGVLCKPGDLLVVHILDIGPLPESNWGYTGIFDRDNGGGLLTDWHPG